MSEAFDPYYDWLGIPPSKRPPSDCDLVGVEDDETDLDRIREAAAARIDQIRSYTLGPQREHASRLLNEVSEALVSLLKAGGADTAEIEKPPPLADVATQPEQPAAPEVPPPSTALWWEDTTETKKPPPPVEFATPPEQPAVLPKADIEPVADVPQDEGGTSRSIVAVVLVPVLLVDRLLRHVAGEDNDILHNFMRAIVVLIVFVLIGLTVKNALPILVAALKVEAVYTVSVQPADAGLLVRGQGARVTGTGAERTITIAEPDGQTTVSVRATLEGYESTEQEIQPERGEVGELTFRLKAMAAVYAVLVEPADVQLSVKGKGVSVTGTGAERTITITEPDGQSTVSVRGTLEGYESAQQEIQPEPGEVGEMAFRLKAMAAVYTVLVQPVDVQLSVSGQGARVTGTGAERKITIAEPDGQSTVSVRATLEGYGSAQQEIQPEPGEVGEIAFRLKAMAVFTVLVEPADAQLSVSGQGASITGTGADRQITITGPDGESTVLVRATLEGYELAEQEIQPERGETRHLTIHLNPLKAKAPFDESEAKALQQRWADHLGTAVRLKNSVGMALVLIPPGEFLMGSPDSDKDAREAEKPQHLVQITKPFYLGAYEVTQEEYEQVIGNNPSEFEGDPQRPVETVSWEDAEKFCERLSEKEGKTYRLPTEAEWEYACRAGSRTKYCFGDSVTSLGDYAWFEDNSGGTTHPVGEKKPNAWRVYGMHGNVQEWCADGYEKGYYANSPSVDPQGASSGYSTRYHVLRGGTSFTRSETSRSAFRNRNPPSHRNDGMGFRICRTP